jgi:cyanophycin synthetase
LNAEDPVLMRRSKHLWSRAALFSASAESDVIAQKMSEGGRVCFVRDGALVLTVGNTEHNLGAIATMPLTANGAARYNVANIAAAVLGAFSIGISVEKIRAVLLRFGAARQDNPGRLERWHIKGVHILIDYAHNPAGLEGLIAVANSVRGKEGRLGLLLGQAGNRADEDIAALANAAVAVAPNRIVLKEIEGMLRGRALGEVPAMLSNALIGAGFQASSIEKIDDEFIAAQSLVTWARAGDVVVLPMHGTKARQAMRDWLDASD